MQFSGLLWTSRRGGRLEALPESCDGVVGLGESSLGPHELCLVDLTTSLKFLDELSSACAACVVGIAHYWQGTKLLLVAGRETIRENLYNLETLIQCRWLFGDGPDMPAGLTAVIPPVGVIRRHGQRCRFGTLALRARFRGWRNGLQKATLICA
jgi:hypothetical protein